MKIEPISDRRALLISGERRALVIADLHIGIEYALESKGIRIPPQWSAMAEEVEGMQRADPADVLIIDGDLKHGIRAGKREIRDARAFLNEMRALFGEIYLVKGNHDGGLQYAVRDIAELIPASGFVFEGVGIFHGHAWPSEEVMGADVLVMGHMHPSVRFVDEIGNSQSEPCWIRGRYRDKELIVMPAMNRFYGGSAVNAGEFLGPVLRSKDFAAGEAEVYLLNGTYMGKMGKEGQNPSEVVGIG